MVGAGIRRNENDLDRYALNDLGEVASGVFRRKQRGYGAGSFVYAIDAAFEDLAGERVHLYLGGLTNTDVGELSLLEVGRDPDLIALRDRDDVLARGEGNADVGGLF